MAGKHGLGCEANVLGYRQGVAVINLNTLWSARSGEVLGGLPRVIVYVIVESSMYSVKRRIINGELNR